ncbi:MAG: sensor diguanylate cyclase [Herminiimonas sp.]|nr:sensor diguanylate cyclase [Herminiimonas sp.]
MFKGIARLIGKQTVGRKLALIYFLDLSAVIFISGILIHEKYIAIDFAKKEIVGNVYIAEVREALFSAAAASSIAGDAALGASRTPAASAVAIQGAEARFGDDMRSAMLSSSFAKALTAAPATPSASLRGNWQETLSLGRELITRIGNQSNLILDPDLDSYYTMSLVVLRFPDLLEILGSVNQLVRHMPALTGNERQQALTQFLILEGRLDAIMKGIESDYAEAFEASAPALGASLIATRSALRKSVEDFRARSRVMAGLTGPVSDTNFDKPGQLAILALRNAWADGQHELDGLVRRRIEQFYTRMWIHLGTALLLLLGILGLVYFVAGQIANPIRRLALVADNVRRTGDYKLRATWHSVDEIGRLVAGFNGMLMQLDSHRIAEQEMVAEASAAQAQRELVEAIPIPLLVTSIPDHRVLHANQAARSWLDGHDRDPWLTGMAPGFRARFFQQLSDLGQVNQFEVNWTGSDGPAWALVSARVIAYQGVSAVLTTFTPVGQMKQMEARLELWAKVFEASSEGIVVMDVQGKILTANPSFCKSTDFERHELTGTKAGLLISDINDRDLFETLRYGVTSKGSWQGELWINRKEGEPYPVWMVMNAVRDANGEITQYIASSLDISERKASEKKIQYLAHHDALTGLPNRLVSAERMKLSIQQARRSGSRVAVLFVDLDRFKNINDSLGHHVGDNLLRSVANRLSGLIREGDTVSRLGGDEFIIILSNIADPESVKKFAERRLIPAMQAPHDIDGIEVTISCSIGIAVCPDDGDDIDLLMRHADTAMYEVKKSGRNNAQFFTTQLNERVIKPLHLESDLRHAIERDELVLYFQPRIGADGVRLTGVESLIRWRHPTEGMIQPCSFIPLAEESGLIIPLGAWVIREAFRQHARWRAEGLGEIPVSINLSAVQLRDTRLLQILNEAASEFNISANQIELELTESTLMQNVAATIDILKQIKTRGFLLSIDDFGTGYSSLNYLHQFPIDKLKIDMSFIQNLHGSSQNLAVTRAIIGLGHTLGLGVVAEGVEHLSDVRLLQKMGCDEFQGYHYAEPMPASRFESWLEKHAMGALEVRATAATL